MFTLCWPKHQGLLQGKHPEILAQIDPVDLSAGGIRSQIAAQWLQIAQLSQCRAYGKPPSLFRMVPSLTHTTFLSHKMGVPCAPRLANGQIFAMGDPIHFMFGSRLGFSGSADRMALFLVTSNPSWRQSAIMDNFEWPSPMISATAHSTHLYSAHRAVIFAIAQLSC